MTRRSSLVAAVDASVLLGAVAFGPAGRGTPALTGTIEEGTFRSKAVDGMLHFSIYLPPGYADSATRYPVIYFLHGLPASPLEYRSIGVVAQAVEQSGHPAIVVGAQGAKNGDEDPEWLNRGEGREWETATAVELVSVIDRRYRTLASEPGAC